MTTNRWDKEYSTQWVEEMQYLSKHNIRYTFVKENDGVTVWKYTKNKELFSCLFEFYRTRGK